MQYVCTVDPNNKSMKELFFPCTLTLYSQLKGCRMSRSDTVSLWHVSLLIKTRFRLFILE